MSASTRTASRRFSSADFAGGILWVVRQFLRLAGGGNARPHPLPARPRSGRIAPSRRENLDVSRTFTRTLVFTDGRVADQPQQPLQPEAVKYFGSRYPVITIDGVRITYPDGWGLLRASNTQPVLVLRFEATSPEARDAHRAELMDWLASRGVKG